MPSPQSATHAYDHRGPAGSLMCTDWCVWCVAFVWHNSFSCANSGRHNFVQISTLWWRLVNFNVAPGVYIEPTVTTSRRESCFSVQLDCIPFQRSIAHRLIFMCSVHKGTLYNWHAFQQLRFHMHGPVLSAASRAIGNCSYFACIRFDLFMNSHRVIFPHVNVVRIAHRGFSCEFSFANFVFFISTCTNWEGNFTLSCHVMFACFSFDLSSIRMATFPVL